MEAGLEPIAESREALLDLSAAIRRRRVTALIGAGVSANAGYPSWKDLLTRLHSRLPKPAAVRSTHGPAISVKDFHRLERMKDLLWRAEEYRRILGGDLANELKKIFGPRRLPPTAAVRKLVKLPFRHVLTTNYDPAIERALKQKGSSWTVIDWGDESPASQLEVERFVRSLADHRVESRLVYLHGRYSNPDRIVLTDSDYFNRYGINDQAQRKLFSLFLTQSVLFVGFSLTDPELDWILRSVRATFRQAEPWHFAILPLDQEDNVEAMTSYFRGRYGIRPIFYPYTQKHEGLGGILDILLKDTLPRSRRARTARAVKPDADDPNRGQFGGVASRSGWRLSAVVEPTEDHDWFHIALTVRAPKRRIASRTVVFHLHPTFARAKQSVRLAGREATLERYCYGAFTVGVEAEKGQVKLELDLAEIAAAPALFKAR